MTSTTETGAARDWLTYFPVSFFAVIMGLAGLTIATHRLEAVLELGTLASSLMFWFTVAIYVVIFSIYAHKFINRRSAVMAEWAHPVRIAFFPTMSIGLILLSVAAISINQDLSAGLWFVGTALHFVFTVMVITAWIDHSRYEVIHLSPAWFIPVVGNVVIPIAGVRYMPVDVSWFFFTLGLVFWVVLLTVVINRLIFHAPLPGRLMPTLFILVAPPAVGFLSWTILNGGVDAFGRVLFFAALVFFVLLLPQVGKFLQLPFALSWWATSFPLAALTLSQFVMAEQTGQVFYQWAGFALYILLVATIVGLAIKTIIAMIRGEICVPEG